MEYNGTHKLSEQVLKEGRAMIYTLESIPVGVLPPGTLLLNVLNDSPDLKYIDVSGATRKFSAKALLEKNSIDGLILQKQSITTDHLIADIISTEKIKNKAITTEKIEDNAVTAEKIKDNSVTSEKIKSIDGSKINNNSIDEKKLKDNIITSSKISPLSINNDHYAYNSITTDKIKSIKGEKIENDSIFSSKLALKCVTKDKIKNNCIDSDLLVKEPIIKTIHLEDESVTSNKIEKECIETFHIKPVLYEKEFGYYSGGINGDKIVPRTINSTHIEDQSITDSKIAFEAIKEQHLDRKLKEKIDAAVITQNEITNITGDLNVSGKIIAQGTIEGSKVFNPVFADFAEAYESRECLEEGDVVEIENYPYVRKTTKNLTPGYIGVVSKEYAACLGASEKDIENNIKIPIGVLGRLPVKVRGKGKPGDYIIAIENGLASVSSDKTNAIGKLLEYKNSFEPEKVLCYIFPS